MYRAVGLEVGLRLWGGWLGGIESEVVRKRWGGAAA